MERRYLSLFAVAICCQSWFLHENKVFPAGFVVDAALAVMRSCPADGAADRDTDTTCPRWSSGDPNFDN